MALVDKLLDNVALNALHYVPYPPLLQFWEEYHVLVKVLIRKKIPVGVRYMIYRCLRDMYPSVSSFFKTTLPALAQRIEYCSASGELNVIVEIFGRPTKYNQYAYLPCADWIQRTSNINEYRRSLFVRFCDDLMVPLLHWIKIYLGAGIKVGIEREHVYTTNDIEYFLHINWEPDNIDDFLYKRRRLKNKPKI